MDEDKPDPVPIKYQDFWETPLNGEKFQYDNKEVNQILLSWVNDGAAATNAKSSLDGRNMFLSVGLNTKGTKVPFTIPQSLGTT